MTNNQGLTKNGSHDNAIMLTEISFLKQQVYVLQKKTDKLKQVRLKFFNCFWYF